MSETPQAGWYPDPNDASQQRYWDGNAWTEHTAAATPQAPAASSAPSFSTAPGMGSSGQAPDTWLWQSIVATVLCCLPLGIAGIVNAAKANSLVGAGDMAGAQAAAAQAKKWTLWSVGVGVGGVVLYALFMVVMVAGSGVSTNF